MEAGRELDRLIQEQVFGNKVVRHKSPTNREDYFYEVAPGALVPVPTYSTHIANAWILVEKLKLAVIPGDDGKWRCECGGFIVDCIWYEVSLEHAPASESAPHAICLAALEAKGVEV